MTAQMLLGQDLNSTNKADWEAAAELLKKGKDNLQSYVMDEVYGKMETGEAYIAPYYAGDVAIMMEINPDLDYALPADGSNLFYDAMCIPSCSKNKENAEKFINFMQKPEIAAENCKYLLYGTPNQIAYDEHLEDEIKNSELVHPSEDYLDKCYTFTNLSNDVYLYMQEQFVKVQAE